MSIVAAFDVDGTLTDRDCVGPFLRRLHGLRGFIGAVGRRGPSSAVAAARRDRDALKEVVVGGVLAGRDVADVDAVGAVFARDRVAGWLRPDTVARLRWHQRSGHHVVLVSASLGPYLRPLGTSMGVDGVMCTDVEILGDRYGWRLDGGNCRGPRKAERLRAWLSAHDLEHAELWAYGDSAGDIEMLAMADRPEWCADVVLDAAPADGSGAPATAPKGDRR